MIKSKILMHLYSDPKKDMELGFSPFGQQYTQRDNVASIVMMYKQTKKNHVITILLV